MQGRSNRLQCWVDKNSTGRRRSSVDSQRSISENISKLSEQDKKVPLMVAFWPVSGPTVVAKSKLWWYRVQLSLSLSLSWLALYSYTTVAALYHRPIIGKVLKRRMQRWDRRFDSQTQKERAKRRKSWWISYLNSSPRKRSTKKKHGLTLANDSSDSAGSWVCDSLRFDSSDSPRDPSLSQLRRLNSLGEKKKATAQRRQRRATERQSLFLIIY